MKRKTIITDMSLVAALVVCKALPADEIEQIEAFGGSYNPEDLAMQVMQGSGPKWACLVAETSEPLVVAGFFQTGACTWRSFMLANKRAWDEHGLEVTLHCRNAIKSMLAEQEHIRLETLCLATRKKAQEWYKKIGLEYESTLHGYGLNGESAVLYSATKGARNY